MGPHGSILAHIKTVRSPMAQDHFWTPPDPKTNEHQNMTHQVAVAFPKSQNPKSLDQNKNPLCPKCQQGLD